MGSDMVCLLPALTFAALHDVLTGFLYGLKHIAALDAVADRTGGDEVQRLIVGGPCEWLDMVPARAQLDDLLSSPCDPNGYAVEWRATPEAAMILVGKDRGTFVWRWQPAYVLRLRHALYGLPLGGSPVHDEIAASHPAMDDERDFLAVRACGPIYPNVSVKSLTCSHFHQNTPGVYDTMGVYGV